MSARVINRTLGAGDGLRLPPHSIEAEQSVLGGLLLDNGAADRIADFLSGDHFYSDAHRLLYNAIMQLIGDNKPADVVTVAEFEVKRLTDLLKAVGAGS